jgi:hypothetical protein
MKNGAALLASAVGEIDGSSWRVSQIHVSRDGRRGDPVWHARVTFWGAQIETSLTLDDDAPDSVRRAVRRAGYGPRYPRRSVNDLRALGREIRRVDRVIDGADVATTFGNRARSPSRGPEKPVPAARIARAIEGLGPRELFAS